MMTERRLGKHGFPQPARVAACSTSEGQAHREELQGKMKPEAVLRPPQTGSQWPIALNKKAGSSLAIRP